MTWGNPSHDFLKHVSIVMLQSMQEENSVWNCIELYRRSKPIKTELEENFWQNNQATYFPFRTVGICMCFPVQTRTNLWNENFNVIANKTESRKIQSKAKQRMRFGVKVSDIFSQVVIEKLTRWNKLFLGTMFKLVAKISDDASRKKTAMYPRTRDTETLSKHHRFLHTWPKVFWKIS